jgi:hypothetical protein
VPFFATFPAYAVMRSADPTATRAVPHEFRKVGRQADLGGAAGSFIDSKARAWFSARRRPFVFSADLFIACREAAKAAGSVKQASTAGCI